MAYFSCLKQAFSMKEFIENKKEINIIVPVFKHTPKQFYFTREHIYFNSLSELFNEAEILIIDEAKRASKDLLMKEIRKIHREIKRNASILPLIPFFLFEGKNKKIKNATNILNERMEILLSIKDEDFETLMTKIVFNFIESDMK